MVVQKSSAIPMDEAVKEEEVKEEPMDVDADPEAEPEPVFESQDKSEKLEEPLFEETIIDGFSFSAFDKYTVLEVSISLLNHTRICFDWYICISDVTEVSCWSK